MDFNFERTDRLIAVIKDACGAIEAIEYMASHFLKDYDRPDFRALCGTLTDITANSDDEATKREKRENALTDYCQRYTKGKIDWEKMLDHIINFNEVKMVKYISRVHWQIQSEIVHGNSTASELKEFISKRLPNEPYKEVVEQVLLKREPSIKDLEAEFWANCPDVNQIDALCNIYRERWKGNLKEVDINPYEFHTLLYDKSNKLHKYFRILRECGLLMVDYSFFEIRIGHIARNISYKSECVVEMFQKLRASAKPTEPNPAPEQDVKDVITFDTEEAIKVLATYILGISAADFKYVIEHRTLPDGAKRAKWVGSRVDAWRFQKALSWGIKAFNSVFEMQRGQSLRANNADKQGIDAPPGKNQMRPGVCAVLQNLGIIQ